MKNKNHILLSLATLLLVAGLFTLGSASPSAEKEMKNSTCCKQKNSGCSPEKETPADGDILLDNISRQFITILSY
jgi:hypothetical protein